jgi:pimeloyl-ACP methyl ester carboxylesterase
MASRYLFAAVFAVLIASATLAQINLAKPDDPAFLLGRREVALSDGRQMNFVCAGTGFPTLVVESGLGSHMLHWQKVAGRLSKLTKTCFYDRAGFGFSDTSNRPLTAMSVTDDLHLLLRNAKVTRPVVLVGHSLGGLYATVYVNRFPKNVAGMVLIEPSFAQQDKDLNTEQRAQDEAGFNASMANLRGCAALARQGRLATETHEECFAFAPDRTAAEKTYLLYQFTRPYRYEAMASEVEAQHSRDGASDVNSKAAVDTRRSYRNIPLIVLTAERTKNPNETPVEREQAIKAWASWKAGHEQLASRSSIGKSLVVSDTNHFIQIDQPDAVVEAVAAVVQQVRQKHSRTR